MKFFSFAKGVLKNNLFSEYLSQLFLPKKLRFEYVIWDIDGTLYNDHAIDFKDEKKLFSYAKRLGEHDKKSLEFWKPYDGLLEVMKKIPQEKQGIVTNGYQAVQKDKLKILGVENLVNKELFFSSYGVAQNALMEDDHPLQLYAMRNGEYSVDNIVLQTQKPQGYMLELVKESLGTDNFVFVGNRWYDVAAANKANIPCIYMVDHCNLDDPGDPVEDGRLKTYAQIPKGDINALEKLLFI